MTAAGGREGVVLVVGTTPDYIDGIRRRAPGRALFLTDPALRRAATEPPPDPREELLCDLADPAAAAPLLAAHLARRGLALAGVTAFDCESLGLAATLAAAHGLPYPTPEAVALCRDKAGSKRRWHTAGVACPAAAPVGSPAAAAAFAERTGGPVVLKPRWGGGSEHVYRCDTAAECRDRHATIAAALAARPDHPLFRPAAGSAGEPAIVAEAFVAGPEYSCDIVVAGGRVTPLRLTRKLRDSDGPFGTTRGYLLCEAPPAGLANETFLATLAQGAAALGIDRAICMVDFLVRNGEMVLLEMTPRPGGDCLPPLLLKALGLDILAFALDFAAGRAEAPPPGAAFVPGWLGIRLLARRAGLLRRIDTAALAADPRVREIALTKAPGHRILLPPADYDSRVLGHLIARIDPGADAREALQALAAKLETVLEEGA